MVVYLRATGNKVPGLYGPTADDARWWLSNYGLVYKIKHQTKKGYPQENLVEIINTACKLYDLIYFNSIPFKNKATTLKDELHFLYWTLKYCALNLAGAKFVFKTGARQITVPV